MVTPTDEGLQRVWAALVGANPGRKSKKLKVDGGEDAAGVGERPDGRGSEARFSAKGPMEQARQHIISTFAQKLHEPAEPGGTETLRDRFEAAATRHELSAAIVGAYGETAMVHLNQGTQSFLSHMVYVLDAVAATDASIRTLWDAFLAKIKKRPPEEYELSRGGRPIVSLKKRLQQARQEIAATLVDKLDAPETAGSEDSLRAKLEAATSRREVADALQAACGGMADSVLTTGGQELIAHVNTIMEMVAPTDEGLQRAWAAICARKSKNGSKRKAADGAVRGGRDSQRQRVAAEDGRKGIIGSDAPMEGHAVNDATLQKMLAEREAARKAWDYEASDRIRDELRAMGTLRPLAATLPAAPSLKSRGGAQGCRLTTGRTRGRRPTADGGSCQSPSPHQCMRPAKRRWSSIRSDRD